jgi:hypothetical protein
LARVPGSENWRRVLVATAILILAGAAVATAGTRLHAAAKRPFYNSGRHSIVGVGFYLSRAPRARLVVSVCLRRQLDRTSILSSCRRGVRRSARRVRARTASPGCPPGIWRTVVFGLAYNRRGVRVDSSSAVSRPFRC